uniref:Kalikludin-like protein n=1 Tax=Trichoplusia ni TaxID=7111 RepID=A9XXB5_TRINI|nr:kalikludin-like protein [Trichoplusia ni]
MHAAYHRAARRLVRLWVFHKLVRQLPARDPRCLQPLETGRCQALFYKYGFDPKVNACVRFVYGGCQGNSNRFFTKELCEKICAA